MVDMTRYFPCGGSLTVLFIAASSPIMSEKKKHAIIEPVKMRNWYKQPKFRFTWKMGDSVVYA